MKGVKTLGRVLVWVFVFLVIAGIIGFFSTFTNGFQEGFKTFYLSYNESVFTAKESKVSFNPDSVNRFDVKYVLGFAVSENADKTYTVEIIPNSDYDELVYSVDGEEFLFGKIEDFTDVFLLDRTEEYFTVTVPENVNLISVLSAKHPNQTVKVPEKYAKVNNSYYTLRVSTYSGNISYDINFNFNAELNIDKDGLIF